MERSIDIKKIINESTATKNTLIAEAETCKKKAESLILSDPPKANQIFKESEEKLKEAAIYENQLNLLNQKLKKAIAAERPAKDLKKYQEIEKLFLKSEKEVKDLLGKFFHSFNTLQSYVPPEPLTGIRFLRGDSLIYFLQAGFGEKTGFAGNSYSMKVNSIPSDALDKWWDNMLERELYDIQGKYKQPLKPRVKNAK